MLVIVKQIWHFVSKPCSWSQVLGVIELERKQTVGVVEEEVEHPLKLLNTKYSVYAFKKESE